jgi:hypothetical protein
MSAMVIHLGLDKPSKDAAPKNENVLVWGGSSSVGAYAIQIASQVLPPHALMSVFNQIFQYSSGSIIETFGCTEGFDIF